MTIPGSVAAALLLAGLTPAPPPPPPDTVAAELPEALGEVAGRIPDLMERDGVPGLVVLVLRQGSPIASAAFGIADPASGRPMAVDAVFRVESISKPVTGWGALHLVEEGRLSLEDPVQDHLTDWRPPPGTPPLPLGALLSHTAGVGLGDYSARYPPGGPVPPLPASLEREFDLVARPGDGFRYSDTGFNLLQLVMEEVTGRPFDAFMESEVLNPLGMRGASYRWTPELAARMPVGHSLRGDPVAPYVYPGLGSGGLLATSEAVGRFAAASMDPPWGSNPSVLTPASVHRLHREAVEVEGLYGLVADGYGLGHFTERLSDGRPAVWHGGQGYGWMSHVHIVPSSGDGIVLLANSQRAWPLFAEVLGSWSRTLGVEPVKMARIGWARPLALVGGTIMVLVALWLLVGWARRPAGEAPGKASVMVRLLAGLALLGAVGWCAGQEYLFLFSVLPGTTGWLGGTGAALGVSLLISTLRRPAMPGKTASILLGMLLVPPLPTAAQEAGSVEVASVEVVHYPSSPVARARSGPFEEASATGVRASLALPFVHRTAHTFLGGRLVGSRTGIVPRPLDPAQPLWVRALYDLEIQLVGSRRLGQGWWITLVTSPGIASDLHHVGPDHLTLQGTVLARKADGGEWGWGVGLTVSNDFGETRLVPLGAVEWTRGPVSLNLLLPARASLEWEVGPGLVAAVDAAVEGNVYTLGRKGVLEGGVVRYSVWELGPRIALDLGDRLRIAVRGGFARGRRLEVEDAGGTRTEDAGLEPGGALAVTLSLLLPASEP